jgi:hypothetical protein
LQIKRQRIAKTVRSFKIIHWQFRYKQSAAGDLGMNTITSSEKMDISGRFAGDWPAPSNHMHNRTQLLHDLRSDAWQSRTETGRTPAKPSQFEQLAADAAGISPHRLRLLGLLLAAGGPTSCGGRSVLRPIWAIEALERAHTMVRLVGALERHMPIEDDLSPWPDIETRLGVKLASVFDGLAISSDEELRPCSVPLREIVRDLVGLFGPALSQFSIRTSVDRLSLPAYQHRARVLIASNLVTHALLHAFQGPCSGQITLRLAVSHRATAHLTVADDTNFISHSVPASRSRCSVIDYLTDLLQSDLVYRPRPGGGMIAELEFPVPGSI